MNRSLCFRGRIKGVPGGGEVGPVFFHCMSRVVAGAKVLGRTEQEVFRRMMRKHAAFCGVEILTYAVMSNHFHLLVRVDPPTELSDEELVDRVRSLYGVGKARAVRAWLADEDEGPRIRQRLLKRMNDVSFFLKELKQRFTIWFNKKHERFGTLWAEKFKSVLVEGDPEVLLKVAGYIDLNPVRAGFCRDPKDYRFCGYGEAVGGSAEARRGLSSIYKVKRWSWREVQRAYRLLLFGKGYYANLTEGRITESALRKVIREKGELTLADALRCRVRYFSEGLAVGSAAFVDAVFRETRGRYWRKRKQRPQGFAGKVCEGMCGLSRVRRDGGK